eukprot:6199885-Pleurochrysis_carterae.AAC.3
MRAPLSQAQRGRGRMLCGAHHSQLHAQTAYTLLWWSWTLLCVFRLGGAGADCFSLPLSTLCKSDLRGIEKRAHPPRGSPRSCTLLTLRVRR